MIEYLERANLAEEEYQKACNRIVKALNILDVEMQPQFFWMLYRFPKFPKGQELSTGRLAHLIYSSNVSYQSRYLKKRGYIDAHRSTDRRVVKYSLTYKAIKLVDDVERLVTQQLNGELL